MSKLNSNEVLYWCHRETTFLLARIQREVRFAAQQPSWNWSGFSVLRVDTSAGSEVYRLKESFFNQATHLSLSMKNWLTDWRSKGLNCLMTNVSLCVFLPAVRGLDDRPRGCRVWQRAGLTTCCPTVDWCMLGSYLLQVTTQASLRTHNTCTHLRTSTVEIISHRHIDILIYLISYMHDVQSVK